MLSLVKVNGNPGHIVTGDHSFIATEEYHETKYCQEKHFTTRATDIPNYEPLVEAASFLQMQSHCTTLFYT